MYPAEESQFSFPTADCGLIQVLVEREKPFPDVSGMAGDEETEPGKRSSYSAPISCALHTISATVQFFRGEIPKSLDKRNPISIFHGRRDFEIEWLDDIDRWFHSRKQDPNERYLDLIQSFRRFLAEGDGAESLEEVSDIIWERFYYDVCDMGKIMVVLGELALDNSMIEGVRFYKKWHEGSTGEELLTYWGWYAFPSRNIEDAIPWLKHYSPEDSDTFDDMVESFESYLAELHTPEMGPSPLDRPKSIHKETSKPIPLEAELPRSPMAICAVSGRSLPISEMEKSSLSGRLAQRELMVRSEGTPGRLGLPDEFLVCCITGKRLLLDEGVTSCWSNKFIDRSVAASSGVSGRKCLPSELIVCEDSGVAILPDESEFCSITRKRVNRHLLSRSDLSERVGLSRLLAVCPESRKRAILEEFAQCEATGRMVDPARLKTCTVSGKRVLQRLMVPCAVSGDWVQMELAVQSMKSGRWAKPEFQQKCPWSDQSLLEDELNTCRITGVRLEQSWIVPGIGAAPLIQLLKRGIPRGSSKTEEGDRILEALRNVNLRVRGLRFLLSPSGNCAAYFVDCSGLFGFRKRHALGFVSLGFKAEILGRPSSGFLVDDEWIPEL